MNPSLSHNFLILALNKRGYFNCNDRHLLYGVATASIIELLDLDVIEVCDNGVKVIDSLPSDRSWLKPVYNAFVAMDDSADIGTMINTLFVPVFTDSRARATLEAYWLTLEENGFLKRKNILFGKYIHKITNQEYFDCLKESVVSQLCEKSKYDVETLTLLFILRHSHRLRTVAPVLSNKDIKHYIARIEDNLPKQSDVYARINRNRDIISCVSFATSALNGNFT